MIASGMEAVAVRHIGEGDRGAIRRNVLDDTAVSMCVSSHMRCNAVARLEGIVEVAVLGRCLIVIVDGLRFLLVFCTGGSPYAGTQTERRHHQHGDLQKVNAFY